MNCFIFMTRWINQTIVFFFSLFFKKKQTINQPIYMSVKDKYVNRMNIRFLSMKKDNYNENITDLEHKTYDSREECISERKDVVEKWERRKLIENIGDCNILMQYDIERQAFVYFCDNRSLSYNVLNAVAMKFVLTFRCCDYFIDNTIEGYDNKSPFLKYKIQENKPDIKKRQETIFNDLSADSPFAKLKGGFIKQKEEEERGKEKEKEKEKGKEKEKEKEKEKGKEKEDEKEKEKEDEEEEEERKEIIVNKFIYLGKFYNMSMLQTVKDAKQRLSFVDYKSMNYLMFSK